MKLSIDNLNPGAWFFFDEAKPESGRIKIRVLNSKKLAQIRNETVKTQVEYKGNNRFEYQIIDHDRRDNIIWDYCIIDWENLTDDKDNQIECNTDNKIKLMNEHVGFANFIEDRLGRLNKEAELLAEYREKN